MKDNEISQVVNVVTPLLKKNTFQEDMNMKQEENLVEVQVGILSGAALNYMVAKVLGYEPWIAKNNSIHHTVRAEHKSNNPQIKYVRLSGTMTDSFDIYEDPALVGEFLFNKLYQYIGIEIRDNISDMVNAKAYRASNIVSKDNIEKMAFGATPQEAGFKLLVMDYLDLPTSTCLVKIPEYVVHQSEIKYENN